VSLPAGPDTLPEGHQLGSEGLHMSGRATALAAVIGVVALAVVVVITVVFAGTGTDDFHRGRSPT
jgi:hypothetical protein